MQSKLLFFLVLIPSLCCAANRDRDNNKLRQVSPPTLAASALKAKSVSRNEGTPSPRIPLADIQPSRPLTPVQTNALESLGEVSDEEDGPEEQKPRKKYTPPVQLIQITLPNGYLSLTAQGKTNLADIEEEA